MQLTMKKLHLYSMQLWKVFLFGYTAKSIGLISSINGLHYFKMNFIQKCCKMCDLLCECPNGYCKYIDTHWCRVFACIVQVPECKIYNTCKYTDSVQGLYFSPCTWFTNLSVLTRLLLTYQEISIRFISVPFKSCWNPYSSRCRC